MDNEFIELLKAEAIAYKEKYESLLDERHEIDRKMVQVVREINACNLIFDFWGVDKIGLSDNGR